MYKVIKPFTDLKSHYQYNVGDVYPYNGGAVNTNRIDELASDKNRMGVPLIIEIEEKPKKRAVKKSETTEE